MKNDMNKKSVIYNALIMIRIVASVGVIVLAALQLFGVWDKAINFAAPLMGLTMLIQSIQEWKQQRRGISVFCLCSAVFILVCAVVVWFVK